MYSDFLIHYDKQKCALKKIFVPCLLSKRQNKHAEKGVLEIIFMLAPEEPPRIVCFTLLIVIRIKSFLFN